MSMAIKTGIRLGIMQPDPIKCVVELQCDCGEHTRRLMMARPGEELLVKFTCSACERVSSVNATPKRLDS